MKKVFFRLKCLISFIDLWRNKKKDESGTASPILFSLFMSEAALPRDVFNGSRQNASCIQ
jgi:hypothetical protein